MRFTVISWIFSLVILTETRHKLIPDRFGGRSVLMSEGWIKLD